jgi:hypothetical protein
MFRNSSKKRTSDCRTEPGPVIEIAKKIREISDINADEALEHVRGISEPIVFRGLVREWPLVQKSLVSDREADSYLRSAYDGNPVTAFVTEDNVDGRVFYTEGLAETNFRQIKTDLGWVLDRIREYESDPAAPVIYMGSMALSYCLPGIKAANSLELDGIDATVRIWIGNRSRVAAHYDVPENIACVCAGKRRFTLFPPDQLENLYVGPIDFTPAGQSISLVDFDDPDLERYPRFAAALEHAQSSELEPGDAIYIPSMWWHHVEGLDDLNILINHWWRTCPNYMGAPQDALLQAILSIRDLPKEQRDAWRGIFDHYVFHADETSLEHIPADRRGVLGELDENAARKLRSTLRNNLNR